MYIFGNTNILTKKLVSLYSIVNDNKIYKMVIAKHSKKYVN